MSLDALTRHRAVVLVVEDDPPLREMYRSALTAAGYAVFAVEDGVDALRFIETHTPAAVVLDLGLPRLPGGDVQREMAAQGLSAIPIIVVTGDPASVDEHDVACLLRKPIDPDALVEAVRRCLSRRR